MLGELFPIFVEVGKEIGKSVTGWATRRVLDALVKCPSCSTTFDKAVLNNSTTTFECAKCGGSFADQRTCATINTVRKDHSLTAAHLQKFEWLSYRTHSGEAMAYAPKVDVLTVNGRDDDLILNFVFRGRRSQKSIHKEIILRPKSHDAFFKDTKAPMIYQKELPPFDDGLAIDAVILNTHRDCLHWGMSKIIEPIPRLGRADRKGKPVEWGIPGAAIVPVQ